MENYCNFKPFDKVLVRYDDQHVWQIDFFSHYVRGVECPYKCLFKQNDVVLCRDGEEKTWGVDVFLQKAMVKIFLFGAIQAFGKTAYPTMATNAC